MELKVKIYYIYKIIFLAFVGFLSAQSNPSDIPLTSTGNIQFYIDLASFRGQAQKTTTEFYLMLFADQLEFSPKNSEKSASFTVNVRINKPNGSLKFSQKWERKAVLSQNSKEIGNMAFYDQWNQILKPGQYRCYVTITDQNSNREGQSDFNFNVPKLLSDMSQIQFVSSVEGFDPATDSKSDPFFKNGRLIYPNPARRYGVLNPVLYVYYELYNLQKFIDDSLQVAYSILDEHDNVIKEYALNSVSVQDENLSLIHGLKVADVPSGIYVLRVDLLDHEGEMLFANSRRFEVIQSDYVKENPVLKEKEAQLFANLLKYIASPQQYDQYKRMDLSTQTDFLVRFLRDKDPNPETLENEYLNRLIKLYKYANQRFSWGKREGWNTDRGRVLIKYGYPDEIKRHDFEEGMDPYHIWNYHQERLYRFVFGDVQGNGNFILLHSNLEEEVHDYNWQKRLKRTF
ncbi:MAG: GWxTD domain-containing protein [Candidatus Marinimicrobia bacterium]|nr:GWxTD domain-containing protein [Candidatus Neomarinimicrobiota bacterium]